LGHSFQSPLEGDKLHDVETPNDRNTPNQSVTSHGNFKAEDCW
jgi:hypothetical protein